MANSCHNFSLTPTQFQFSNKNLSLLKKLRSINECISSKSDSRISEVLHFRENSQNYVKIAYVLIAKTECIISSFHCKHSTRICNI